MRDATWHIKPEHGGGPPYDLFCERCDCSDIILNVVDVLGKKLFLCNECAKFIANRARDIAEGK